MEKVCKDYMLSRHPYKKNKGCTRNNCKYIHDENLCYFFYKDNCNKGDDCKFNHVVDNNLLNNNTKNNTKNNTPPNINWKHRVLPLKNKYNSELGRISIIA